LSRELTPEEFRQWVAVRFADQTLPGIRGVGFIRHVQRTDLSRWVAEQRQQGAPDFKVRSTGDAPDLYVISRIEPLANNRAAWGYDVGSERARRQGIEAAIRDGRLTLTSRIVLVQDGQKRPGFLLFLPVYRPGARVDTPDERRAHLLGVVYAPIVVEELVAGIGQNQSSMIDFGLFDSPNASPSARLAGSMALTSSSDQAPQHQQHFSIYVGGQALTLAAVSTEGFLHESGQTSSIWVGLLGSVLSAALALMVWLLSAGRSQAEALAADMTVDLKQAKLEVEDALRESQSLLSTLDQFSLVCITAPDGNIQQVNEAFCRACGYTSDELVGRNPRILASGEHGGFFWVELWQTLLHGKPWSGQICNLTRSGDRYWVQTVIAPIRRADGQVDRYISIAHDITEARRVQDELTASAERYNLAIDGGSDGLWDWMNVHAQDEWWSPQFFRLLGYEPNEIRADLVTFDTMLHPDHQEAAFAALEAALSANEPYDVEYLLRTKSGQYRWFRSRAKVFFDDFGAATRMAGSIQDIHDRKMAEARLQEHSAQMAAIFSLSPDGFVSFDAQGCVAYTSPAFAGLTGLPAQWALGMSEREFGQRFFQLAEPGQLVASLDDLRHHAGRLVLEMKPPARRMLEIRLSQGQGEAVSQVLALRDVTHEAEIEQMKSAFLSMAAHELRTPMASIFGFTELLLTRDFKPDKQKDLLRRIYRQSEGMSGIINELLDLARIESRRGKDFSLEACHLQDLVAEVVGDFKLPEGREAPVVLPLDRGAMVWVDRQKMKQAILNVLSNAYKYSPHGGEVRIAFHQNQAQLGVEILDHGIGLSPDQVARVGERFYRADKSGRIPGTGLGVTIVKEIVELMGGWSSCTANWGKEPGCCCGCRNSCNLSNGFKPW